MIPSDENLDDLLKAIRGETGLGPGFSTYPDESAEDQKKLHEACLQLERQGLIFRVRDIPADGDAPAFIHWKSLPCHHESFVISSAVTRTLKQDGAVKSVNIHIRVDCSDCKTRFVFDDDPRILNAGVELRVPVRPKIESSLVLPKFGLRKSKKLTH